MRPGPHGSGAVRCQPAARGGWGRRECASAYSAGYVSSCTSYHRVVIERDRALELPPLHLPAPGHREGIEKADNVRSLVLGHRVAGEMLDLFARDHGTLDRDNARA